ncbi:MAG TPA: patatin-like phospholipase family protein [Candidatus Paceibacterota bacterium]|nr:patatin-like phospholipase family protein [Candidatus Paceibacterota bacterium]
MSSGIKEPKVALLLPGEFRRLAPHQGALETWFDPGIGLPRPYRIVGGSAGAIMATAHAPGNPINSAMVHEVIRDLKPSQIFSVPMEKKVAGLLAAGALSFPLLSHLEPELKPPARFLLHAGQTLFGIALGYYVVRSIFTSQSIFDNSPLERLLLNTMDFEAIVKSDIEVRITATDIETGEHVVFSTHAPGLTLRELVNILLASATVPVHFPLRRVGSRVFTDAEVRTNFPIGELEDADVVFVFSYAEALGSYPVPKTWGDHFNGMWNIIKTENARKDRAAFERRRREEPNLPEVVFLNTDRAIPPLQFENFNRRDMERSIRLGSEVIQENLEVIGGALGRAAERVKARE